jgi:penicillin-binding protein 2
MAWLRLKHKNHDIDPDEIFLDSKNLPDFDRHQFEGRLEKPIGWRTLIFSGALFLIIGLVFSGRLWYLQAMRGQAFAERSENNSLHHTVVFADRGVIYDRNNQLIAWNVENPTEPDFSLRKYSTTTGMAPLLGYIKYPSKDSSGFYYREDYLGMDGVEKHFNSILEGTNGTQITETDVFGKVNSQSVMNPPQTGKNLTLSIDSRLQHHMYQVIEDTAKERHFVGGAGVIMDIHTGELLADVSYPEFDSQVMTDGTDTAQIKSYFSDSATPMLDRVAAGVYAPGSIVKPIMAMAALDTGVITASKVLYTHGYISLPNPYDPDHPSLFRDWKDQGAVDMRKAIEQSSDVYFYEVGGGFGDQKGMGIYNIEKYAQMFGFGQPVGSDFFGNQKGTIPTPEWKAQVFKGDDWRVGDTYHSVIGQYGWQVTPLQVVRATAAIANYGTLLKPTVIANDTSMLKDAVKIPIQKAYFDVAHEGMRQSAEHGTAVALNMPTLEFGGKTGTAQIGVHNEFYNSWIIGFFPYENPKYAFAFVMERGPAGNPIGAPAVSRQFFDWMVANAPEYAQ